MVGATGGGERAWKAVTTPYHREGCGRPFATERARELTATITLAHQGCATRALPCGTPAAVHPDLLKLRQPVPLRLDAYGVPPPESLTRNALACDCPSMAFPWRGRARGILQREARRGPRGCDAAAAAGAVHLQRGGSLVLLGLKNIREEAFDPLERTLRHLAQVIGLVGALRLGSC